MKDVVVIGIEQTLSGKIRAYNDHGNVYIVDYYVNRSKLWEDVSYYKYTCHHANKIMQKLVYTGGHITDKARGLIVAHIHEMLCDIMGTGYIKRTEKMFRCDVYPLN